MIDFILIVIVLIVAVYVTKITLHLIFIFRSGKEPFLQSIRPFFWAFGPFPIRARVKAKEESKLKKVIDVLSWIIMIALSIVLFASLLLAYN